MISAYIETTIFNRYFEVGREFCADTRLLFEKIRNREVEAYTSVYVIGELADAPESKRNQMMELINQFDIGVLGPNNVAQELADIYVKAEIIPLKFRMDGVHIAMAAVNNLDYIVSLNFRHINKAKTKMVTEAIHKVHGYSSPFICSPAEVF